ncbi:hypothetical protein ACJ72_05041 [Emergomyces africanus]|uniref:Knr4/Smi1-like domain-containing protein n=1 Tax=Emergomyces africanus TaxID=1955775 RepID=A0A1B7NV30_9EURO|nr:hypothetical protein ACJ72_05041 [Emergomyces africanus]
MPHPFNPKPFNSNSDSNCISSLTNEDIKADIEKLRTIFAPKRTAPPLGWPAVHVFESRHGIILPEPYRTFVAEIANGCRDGPPHYGLESISNCCSRNGNGPEEDRLALPFPLTQRWIWEDEPEQPEGFPSSAVDEEGGADIFGRGCLDLGTEGCGMHWYLIISGEHRGQVWLLTGEGAAPFAGPAGFTKAQQGFAGWAFHWASGNDMMTGNVEDHVVNEGE